jgi:hypothetical protein
MTEMPLPPVAATPEPADETSRGARECRVRDYFAQHVPYVRPRERLVSREQRYDGSLVRADMRTVDEYNVLREWEFKLHADRDAIGQILQYVALARRQEDFRPIRPVIAAFTFTAEMICTVEVMNLNIELVTIPDWMRWAGGLPPRAATPPVLMRIPRLDLADPSTLNPQSTE